MFVLVSCEGWSRDGLSCVRGELDIDRLDGLGWLWVDVEVSDVR